ncbi:MAG: glycoside hydrolase family 35 protein [Planctomycetota bacterium]|jgi:hypothetical protein
MANVSYNPQSLVIDSVRAWLVSGTIDYARLDPARWRRRVTQARHAGLNTVLVPVPWAHHEPEPDHFDFTGPADLRGFVQLLADEGLACVLRPGPFIGAGRDMGGLPPWLLRDKRPRLRQASPAFLQAVARYYNAVFAQLKGLLATDSPTGPVCLVQIEHRWLCHHPRQGEDYLKALHRFMHEAGCQLPIVHANNLYQPTVDAIEAWADGDDLFAVTRQLRAVQPEAPRLAMSLPTGPTAVWGQPTEPADPDKLMRDMARVAAAGGAFNLEPFAAPTNLASDAGALIGDGFCATDPCPHAPVTSTGRLNATHRPVKRLATFLAQFENLMSHLHPDVHPSVCDDGVAVIQQTGSQGAVVFFIRAPGCEGRDSADVITPDGQRLLIHFGQDPVAWITLNVNLDTLGVLNLTNLRPWGRLGARTLVFYGPAGTDALVSLNNTLHTTTVPKGDEPRVIDFSDVRLVVLNEKQVDAAYLEPDGLRVGAEADGEGATLVFHDGFKTAFHIDPVGKITRQNKPTAKASVKRPAPPKLGPWIHAKPDAYTRGDSPRYAKIKGPTGLEACGADEGYGWYRLTLQRDRAKKTKILIPRSGDRLHLYHDAKRIDTLGVGPGASIKPVALDLPGGASTLVALADVLGRADGGLAVERPRGVCGPVLDVKPLKPAKPETETAPRVDPFAFGAYVPDASIDDRAHYRRDHFDLKTTNDLGFVVTLTGPRPRTVLLLNGEPIALDPGDGRAVTLNLNRGARKGVNRVTLACIDPAPDGYDPLKNAAIYQVVEDLTADADWHYAKWAMPADSEFAAPPASATKSFDQPTFFRTTFDPVDRARPLRIELGGVSKGRMWLNGHRLGRYFIATRTGKKVPPQTRYDLPPGVLRDDAPNTLTLFDEHGKLPARCKLIYDDPAP